MRNKLKLYYVAGPGDVVGTFRFWREGRADPRQVSVTYSEQFFQLARDLDAQVRVISSHTEAACEEWNGWRVENRPKIWRQYVNRWTYVLDQWSYGARLCWDLCRWRPHTAVIAEGAAPWICFLLPALLGVKIVAALHCVLWPPARGRSLAKRICLAIEAVAFRWGRFKALCASQVIEEQLEEMCGRGIPVRPFLPTYRSSVFSGETAAPEREGPFRLLYAGRMEADKGVFDLLEALRRLEAEQPGSWRLDFCGEGSAKLEVMARIEASGLQEIAMCHGHCARESLVSWVRQAHLLVVPTTSGFVEGFNQVVAEGMLAGRPVVATTVCPAAHLFLEAVCLVSPDDPEALREAIHRMEQSPGEYRKMAQATIKYRTQLYDWAYSWRDALRGFVDAGEGGGRIGYLVPEFPSQTHAFFWREISAMRAEGASIRLFSTREPGRKECQHAFSEEARRETEYVSRIGIGALGVLASRPWGLWRSLRYVLSLHQSSMRERIRCLALIVCAARLVELCARGEVKHVHIHSCADAAHLGAIGRLLGGPRFSLTLHGDLDVYGRDHEQKFRQAEWVSAVTRPLQRQIVERTGLAVEKVPVIWMGVDTGVFAPRQSEGDRAEGALRMATVARLIPQKGHLFALEALRSLKADGYQVRYTIAGSGPFRDAIEAKVEELGLQEEVEMMGNVSEDSVLGLLQRTDVFLLPSYGLGEAAPVSVMEAMACGLPVVCSRIGGTPDMMTHLRDGWLVPQQDVSAIRGALAALAQDRDLRRRLGRNARETALQQFDYRINAARLLACLRGEVPGAGETGRELWKTAA